MPDYRINYFKNVPSTGWTHETIRVPAANKQQVVARLSAAANVRCVEVVRLK